MNLHRWTCLTTVILTTVISPIATVAAKASSLVVGSRSNYISPQSLPTITPLRVTELQTDAVIPVVQIVPQVTKLPIVTPLYGKIKAQATFDRRKLAKALPVKTITPLSPVDLIRSTAPVSNPNFQATESLVLLANPTDTTIAPVNPVLPLPTLTARTPTPSTFTPVTTTAATAPIPVVRGSQSPTQIAISTTATAQIPHIWQAQSGFGMGHSKMTAAAGTTIDKSQLNLTPQATPIIGHPQDRSDLPGFEAGSPVFVFNHQPAQQIVTTTIAQVGETIVAPEPSIAIPIQRPNQPMVPAVAPSTVKAQPPAVTTKPALEQIVATQTGQASWYGSEGGSQTASGEKYNPNGLTAAHRTLPFGTQVRITSLKTGKTVTVRINDRGPFRSRRIVDISAGAAEVIGIKADGVGDVRMEILASKG